jgi:hypothetical protein
MSIQRIEFDEASVRAVQILGLDESAVDLLSQEGLCASLRRAASFLCPASPQQIVDAVLDVVMPLTASADLQRNDVMELLDLLVSSGDLLELRKPESRTRLLFLGPPSYVEKQPGEYRLLGVRPYGEVLLDEDALGAAVVYEGHTRSVVLDAVGAAEVLGVTGAGLHRLTAEQWTKAPRQDPAAAVIEQARQRLAGEHAPGRVSGLSVIDSATSVRYYKGRWREPAAADSGVFVGRRPQAYGAPIWCVVELEAGIPQAVVDLPVESATAPGWDEARRIQAALDAQRDAPQVCRVGSCGSPDGTRVMDFFAPLPSWAERYLELTVLPIPKSQGALFSYQVPEAAVSNAMGFLSKSLWMTAATDGEQGR